jgi:hypothetical protein
MAELSEYILQFLLWCERIEPIALFHSVSGQKQQRLQHTYEIKHLANPQTIFQTICGIARQNHTPTCNLSVVNCATVDKMEQYRVFYVVC